MKKLQAAQYSKMDQVQVWNVTFRFADGTAKSYTGEQALWAPYEEAFTEVKKVAAMWGKEVTGFSLAEDPDA